MEGRTGSTPEVVCPEWRPCSSLAGKTREPAGPGGPGAWGSWGLEVPVPQGKRDPKANVPRSSLGQWLPRWRTHFNHRWLPG